MKKRRSLSPYIYLIPCMVIFIMFVFLPFLKTFIFSFAKTSGQGKFMEFVAVNNYIKLFKSKQFWNSFTLTLKFAPLVAIPTILISYFLAAVAHNKSRGSYVYELMYSLPMAIASAPAAAIWFALLSPTKSGIINHLLGTEIRWLLDKDYAIFGVAFVTVWMSIGVNFIFMLTGFRNVPQELMESATIDGAGYFRKLFSIMTPIASPQIFLVIFLNITTSFQSFAQIRLLTEGGPSYSTNVLVYSIYQDAIRDSKYSSAYAQSMILFVVILVITLIQFKLEDKVVHYK